MGTESFHQLRQCQRFPLKASEIYLRVEEDTELQTREARHACAHREYKAEPTPDPALPTAQTKEKAGSFMSEKNDSL